MNKWIIIAVHFNKMIALTTVSIKTFHSWLYHYKIHCHIWINHLDFNKWAKFIVHAQNVDNLEIWMTKIPQEWKLTQSPA